MGYLIGCANIPFLNKNLPNSIAIFSSPIIIGMICVLEFILYPIDFNPNDNFSTLFSNLLF